MHTALLGREHASFKRSRARLSGLWLVRPKVGQTREEMQFLGLGWSTSALLSIDVFALLDCALAA